VLSEPAGRNTGKLPYVNRCRRIIERDVGRAGLRCRYRELFQNGHHCRIRIERHELRHAVCRRREYCRALRPQPFVLEFVGSIDKEFILKDCSSRACTKAVVIKAVLDISGEGFRTESSGYLLVRCRVEIPVAGVPPSGAVSIVRSGLGYDVELPAGRMAIFRAELVRQEREFRD